MAAEEKPAIRVAWAQVTMKHVKALNAPERDAIYARIGELRRTIRASSVIGYLDVSEFVLLADAIMEAIGQVRARAFFRQVFMAAVELPLASVIVSAALRNAVDTPGVLRYSSSLFGLIHRNCGEWGVSIDEARKLAVLTLAHAPLAILRSEGIAAAYHGNIEGALTRTRKPGQIVQRPGPPLKYEVSW